MINKHHKFHLVEKSPWPVVASLSALLITTTIILWFNKVTRAPIFLGLLLTIFIAFCWWRDVDRESLKQGEHTFLVIKGLKIGMILFISSEVLFFLSFFWAFFHSRMSPTLDIGHLWPPLGVIPFDPLNIPLVNTILLLSSGVTVTWAHHAILEGKLKSSINSLYTTVILGVLFTLLQGFEYSEAPFSIRDSAFGCTFFVATGFHGLHVIIGSTFFNCISYATNKNW